MESCAENTRESLIPHRTLTHWPALWLAVAASIAHAIDNGIAKEEHEAVWLALLQGVA